MAVKLLADAAYGYGGKQYIARITGRDSKFTFAREFLGRKAGKRGDTTEVLVDEPGLYETRDVDRKGRVTDTYYVVETVLGGVEEATCGKEKAMSLARLIGEGVPFAEAVASIWPPKPVETPTEEPTAPVAEEPDYSAQLATVPTEALVAALVARGYRVEAPVVVVP